MLTPQQRSVVKFISEKPISKFISELFDFLVLLGILVAFLNCDSLTCTKALVRITCQTENEYKPITNLFPEGDSNCAIKKEAGD